MVHVTDLFVMGISPRDYCWCYYPGTPSRDPIFATKLIVGRPLLLPAGARSLSGSQWQWYGVRGGGAGGDTFRYIEIANVLMNWLITLHFFMFVLTNC